MSLATHTEQTILSILRADPGCQPEVIDRVQRALKPERTLRPAAQLLTIRQFADQAGIHVNTVRNLVKRGSLQPVRLTKYKHRYRPEDLERCLAGELES